MLHVCFLFDNKIASFFKSFLAWEQVSIFIWYLSAVHFFSPFFEVCMWNYFWVCEGLWNWRVFILIFPATKDILWYFMLELLLLRLFFWYNWKALFALLLIIFLLCDILAKKMVLLYSFHSWDVCCVTNMLMFLLRSWLSLQFIWVKLLLKESMCCCLQVSNCKSHQSPFFLFFGLVCKWEFGVSFGVGIILEFRDFKDWLI